MAHRGDWIVKNPQSPSELCKFSYEIDTRTGEVLILGSTVTVTEPKKAYEEVRRLQSGPGSFDNLFQQQEQKPEPKQKGTP
jgi:hypothetical protein